MLQVEAQGPFDSSNRPERSIRHCEGTRFLDHEADRCWILTHGPAVGKGRDFKEQNATPPGLAERPAAAGRHEGGALRVVHLECFADVVSALRCGPQLA